MTDFDAIDFFRDPALVADPYPVLRGAARRECPVQREPHHDVVMVTGYDEAVAVYHDTATLLVVQLGDRAVPGVPGAARRRRRRARSSSSTATSCR